MGIDVRMAARTIYCAVLATLAAACASKPTVEVTNVRVWTPADVALGAPVPDYDARRQPNGTIVWGGPYDSWLQVTLALSDTEPFEKDFWRSNTFTEARFCAANLGTVGTPRFNEPVFASELGTRYQCGETTEGQGYCDQLIPVDHPSPGADAATIFLRLYNGKMSLFEDIELPGGGLTHRFHEHDPVASPADICAEVAANRYRRVSTLYFPLVLFLPGWMSMWQQRSEPFVISGEAIAEALAGPDVD